MSPARLQGLSGQSELEAGPARQLDGAVVRDRGRRFLFNMKASCLTAERAVRRSQAPHHQKYVTILSPTLLPGTEDFTTPCESPFPGPAPARAVPRLSLHPQGHQPLHADTTVPSPVCECRVSEEREPVRHRGGGWGRAVPHSWGPGPCTCLQQNAEPTANPRPLEGARGPACAHSTGLASEALSYTGPPLPTRHVGPKVKMQGVFQVGV